MDADTAAFNKEYDVNSGLEQCGGRCSIAEAVAKSGRRYFGAAVPPLLNAPRLVFAKQSETGSCVGPGSYDLSGETMGERSLRSATPTCTFTSKNGRLNKLEWSVPCDVYGKELHAATTVVTTEVQRSKTDHPSPRDPDGFATHQARLPYGKFGRFEKREFNTVSWAKSDPRCVAMPYSQAGRAKEFVEGVRHHSVTLAATAQKRGFTQSAQSFGSSKSRKFKCKLRKREKDVIPEVCFPPPKKKKNKNIYNGFIHALAQPKPA